MANLQKWSPIAPAWVDVFGVGASNLNIANFTNGLGIISTTTIVSDGSLYMDISFQCTSISPSGVPAITFFLLGLLADGATFADGDNNTSTAANQPTQTAFLGTIFLRTKASSAQNQLLRGLLIPPGSYVLYVVNNSGVTLPSTGTVCKARLYAETNNG